MNKVFLILIMFFCSTTAYCCDCVSHVEKSDDYEKSDYVFIGRVLENDIEVIEVFKGKLPSYIKLFDKFSCSISVQKGEKWLFYASESSHGITVSSCGWSRNFNNPLNSNSIHFPLPDSKLMEIDPVLAQELISIKSYNELYSDIQFLRQEQVVHQISYIKHLNLGIILTLAIILIVTSIFLVKK
ncbi:hypothetical protein AB9P05_05485 [Roseivirga sp. BDSF3-8]|uniref:hypothetical protein n=1 Tax=Roseivirga sp. BDSF3-8 TaxID=3241598 RepID=UPI0035320BA0